MKPKKNLKEKCLCKGKYIHFEYHTKNQCSLSIPSKTLHKDCFCLDKEHKPHTEKNCWCRDITEKTDELKREEIINLMKLRDIKRIVNYKIIPDPLNKEPQRAETFKGYAKEKEKKSWWKKILNWSVPL